MKSIILKEFRENAKWALLILLLLAAVMAYAVKKDDQNWSGQPGASLVSSMAATATVFGFSTAGIALAMLQILQDKRRGRWAFLAHRPITPQRIFIAKIAVGATLYLLACAIPLAATTWWLATPGHISGPFDWHEIQARLSDLIGGLVWYIAALLAAARPARWVGSRLMPLGLALITSMLVAAAAMNFLEAVLIYFAAMLILLPAAWNTFVTSGFDRTPPLFMRFLQGLSVLAGIGFAVGAGCVIATSFILMITGSESRFYTYHLYTTDGQIYWVTQGLNQTTDLQGHVIPEKQAEKLTKDSADRAAAMFTQTQEQLIPRADRLYNDGFQSVSAYAQWVYRSENSENPVHWFYVVNRHTLEGYDSISHHYVGSIGPSGFRPAPEPAEPFNEDVYTQYGSHLLVSPTTVYSVDLIQRQITQVYRSPPGETILGAGSNILEDQTELGLIVTQKTIHAFNDWKELFSLPLEHGYRDFNYLELNRLDQGRFYLNYIRYWGNTSPSKVVEVGPAGTVLRRFDLASAFFITVGHDPAWLPPVGALAVPPCAALLIPFHAFDDAGDFNLPWLWIEMPIVGIVSAAIAFVLLRRRYDPTPAATAMWLIFTFALGLSGILLLLCTRSRAAKLKCPRCGKSRPVTCATCPSCQAAFDKPRMEGIEIFEEMMA